ncbi:MAG: hypothetical protein KAI47_03235, partial [Deltaproteobacteria bacterium]|nr:hypothetical protein [Deltaproteobacteria bacterium]
KIRRAALRRGETRKVFLFYRSLLREIRKLKSYRETWRKRGLYSMLGRVYARKLQQTRALLTRALKTTAREVAEEMLHTEEQVNLLEYEVGQAIFQRVEETGGVAKAQKAAARVPLSSTRVYYKFTGEYWTDELPRYKFNIEDRCVE